MTATSTKNSGLTAPELKAIVAALEYRISVMNARKAAKQINKVDAEALENEIKVSMRARRKIHGLMAER